MKDRRSSPGNKEEKTYSKTRKMAWGGREPGSVLVNPRVSSPFRTAGTLCNMEREAEKWESDVGVGKFWGSISYVILLFRLYLQSKQEQLKDFRQAN